MIRRYFVALALGFCVSALPGCGDDDKTTDKADQATQVILVAVQGGEVTPNGERIQVEVGRPIELVVEADAPGSFHVHADPEFEFEYGTGTTTSFDFTIDRPGIIEVESHDLHRTVVQLEVR